MMDIDTLEAGPELDELIAKQVMGWRRPDPDFGREETWVDESGAWMAEADCGTEDGGDYGPCSGECDDDCLRFRPSSNGQDARRVLKELKNRGITLTVVDPEPDAICRAALKAVTLGG